MTSRNNYHDHFIEHHIITPFSFYKKNSKNNNNTSSSPSISKGALTKSQHEELHWFLGFWNRFFFPGRDVALVPKRQKNTQHTKVMVGIGGHAWWIHFCWVLNDTLTVNYLNVENTLEQNKHSQGDSCSNITEIFHALALFDPVKCSGFCSAL